MLARPDYERLIRERLHAFPVVAILGPRQCGKTTLAKRIGESEGAATFFDLEDPRALARLENPLSALEPLRGLVVLDEVQRKPDLFPLLRVLADRTPPPARFLILGNASPSQVRDVSESLAGRAALVEVAGFGLDEVPVEKFRDLWLRGGFPRSFLADNDAASFDWREEFVKTFLERDLPQLGITVPSATMRRFWTMPAHFHGQVWNSAELARSLGTAEATTRRYLDILSSAFVVRQLPPWFENLAKRQVKSAKIYIRDSGLAHSLLSIATRDGLESHPKLGASWEGFALESALRIVGDRNAYFWGTHAGAELDLFVLHDGKRYGFEMKYADAPRSTKSMHTAVKDLHLERLLVVYPGTESYALNDRAEVVSILKLKARWAALVEGR